MIDRLKLFISHLGMSDRAFAISCGIAQNTLSRQLSGARELSLTTVVAVSSRYPELSLVWLFSGKEEMLTSKSLQTEGNEAGSERVNKLIDTVAFLQSTVNEQQAYIKALEEKNDRLSSELVMLKNERRIS